MCLYITYYSRLFSGCVDERNEKVLSLPIIQRYILTMFHHHSNHFLHISILPYINWQQCFPSGNSFITSFVYPFVKLTNVINHDTKSKLHNQIIWNKIPYKIFFFIHFWIILYDFNGNFYKKYMYIFIMINYIFLTCQMLTCHDIRHCIW